MAKAHTLPGAVRALLPVALALALPACSAPSTNAVDGAADEAGALHVPVHYRSTYEPAGTWSVAADSGSGAKELHVVYASPGALDAWRRTGSYPDGSVLVKEVYAATTAPMTTGTISTPGALKGWFVMVRAGSNPHPGDTRWGDGWGWGWFDAASPRQTKTDDYRSACLGCHEPARKTQLTYTHGYPASGR